MTNYYQNEHGGAWTEDVTTVEYKGRFDVIRSAPYHKVKFYFGGEVEVSGVSADVKPGGVY